MISMETRPDGYIGPLDPARRAGTVYAVTGERLAGYEDGLAAAGLDPAALRIEERPCTARARPRDAAPACSPARRARPRCSR